MRPPDTRFATAALAPTQATAPARALGQPGAHFSSVFRQVQGEVDRFLAHGAPAPVQADQLSPEGRLWRERGAPGGTLAAIERAAGAAGVTGAAGPADTGPLSSPGQRQFLAAIQPWAEETGQRLGVASELVAAHAALESGWGQRPLRHDGGADTYNLFGIKAGPAWQGSVAASATTEYEHGAALKKVEQFRSYPDQASAFRDYAQVLLDNPRYRAALHTGSDARAFALGLAQGGYATDPRYADKLTRLATRLQSAAAGAATQSGD
ncbi:MAG: glucosaminidase domain-containing protein [Pseudomonadota bacterium]